ncbi:DUF4242 domain-containing protein [Arthrobacter globiformis]|uniref:DUF4242 domain-containing protein n=1 Tax=Arthrobacter globiformis TaxID=1665 RepID=UPI00278CFA0E|nr:DUF4242 domain-containing protein [Arthrobacter globiformis]MDQ0618445.1 hypothetical protein [Arthrobacter globiformis]
MSLFLFEVVPATRTKEVAFGLIEAVTAAAARIKAEVIESQVAAGNERIFIIIEAAGDPGLEAAVSGAVGDRADQLTGPDEVRLIGAELEDIKSLRKTADYLVEWDIPADIDMETYLARKKANSPKYAEVPEVSFLRTYVREDTVKCLCFYDAPDEASVKHAREVVSTPIDRIHKLG